MAENKAKDLPDTQELAQARHIRMTAMKVRRVVNEVRGWPVDDALTYLRFAPQAAAKRLEIGYNVDPDVPPWIVGDVTRLRQIIVNLVNNAIKFTPTGSISIMVRRIPLDPTVRAMAAVYSGCVVVALPRQSVAVMQRAMETLVVPMLPEAMRIAVGPIPPRPKR